MRQSIIDIVDDIIDEANTVMDSEDTSMESKDAFDNIISLAEAIQDKASNISSLAS